MHSTVCRRRCEPLAPRRRPVQTMVRYGFHLAEEFPQVLSAAGKLAPFALFFNPGLWGKHPEGRGLALAQAPVKPQRGSSVATEGMTAAVVPFCMWRFQVLYWCHLTCGGRAAGVHVASRFGCGSWLGVQAFQGPNGGPLCCTTPTRRSRCRARCSPWPTACTSGSCTASPSTSSTLCSSSMQGSVTPAVSWDPGKSPRLTLGAATDGAFRRAKQYGPLQCGTHQPGSTHPCLPLTEVGFSPCACCASQSLLGKLVKRARSFLRWRATLKNLQSALPDASADDISSFADDCAICKVSSNPGQWLLAIGQEPLACAAVRRKALQQQK